MSSLTDVFWTHVSSGHKDIDCMSFIRLCRESGLWDGFFTESDAERVFTATMPLSRRRLDFQRLVDALRRVAEIKGVEEEVVHRMVIDAHQRKPQAPPRAGSEPIKRHRRRSESSAKHHRAKKADEPAPALDHSHDENKRPSVPLQWPSSCPASVMRVHQSLLLAHHTVEPSPATAPVTPCQSSGGSAGCDAAPGGLPDMAHHEGQSAPHENTQLAEGSPQGDKLPPAVAPVPPAKIRPQMMPSCGANVAMLRPRASTEPLPPAAPSLAPGAAEDVQLVSTPPPSPEGAGGSSMQLPQVPTQPSVGGEVPAAQEQQQPAEPPASPQQPAAQIEGPTGYRRRRVQHLASTCITAVLHGGNRPKTQSFEGVQPLSPTSPSTRDGQAGAAYQQQHGERTIADVFKAFCFGKPDMDSKGFVRLSKRCCLLDSKFTAHDARLLFSSAVPINQLRMDAHTFEIVLAQIAAKRGVDQDIVRKMVLWAEIPVSEEAANTPTAEGQRPHSSKEPKTNSLSLPATPSSAAEGGEVQRKSPSQAGTRSLRRSESLPCVGRLRRHDVEEVPPAAAPPSPAGKRRPTEDRSSAVVVKERKAAAPEQAEPLPRQQGVPCAGARLEGGAAARSKSLSSASREPPPLAAPVVVAPPAAAPALRTPTPTQHMGGAPVHSWNLGFCSLQAVRPDEMNLMIGAF